MTADEEDLLIEQVAGAWRPDSTTELQYHKAWHDLSAAARVRAFERAVALRRAEAALDRDHLSTTSRAVLAKIMR